MTQKVTLSPAEKEQARQELCVLLSEGLNEDGEKNNSSLFGSENLHYGNILCERVGLYY